ncbi:MAG TPA: hypothetical protein ENJ09_07145 [Planctomycetes bacterium]|nr:hypothetical protein [Planctomycetota bacterium]
MMLAQVLGTVVAPYHHPVLEGERLLLVRPVTPTGEATGRARIAIDRVDAGEGDRVLVVDEGNSARQLVGAPEGPVKTVVVGVVDTVELGGTVVFGVD